MAEPSRPAGEPTGDARPVAAPGAAPDPDTELLAPPTEAELTETGEPSYDEIRAAAAGDTEVIRPADTEVIRPAETAVITPAETEVIRPAETAVITPAETAVLSEPAPPAAEPAAAAQQVAPPPPPPPAAPTPPAAQPTLEPAADSAPLPPLKRGNRLAGFAWVLLAAGLFEVLFFAVNALVVFAFGTPAAVVPQLQQIAATPLAWLPVLLFFLLYLLTVLLLNRAGRVAYVFTSLLVGVVVYVASVLLFLLIERQTLGDSNTLAQTFLNWEFIVIGLVAREVMLWTGIAVGSRGIRVRARNRAAREQYDRELADARA